MCVFFFTGANNHTRFSFMMSLSLMCKHVSSYLPRQVFLEVLPEMQPELSEDGRKPERYEEVSGMKRFSVL